MSVWTPAGLQSPLCSHNTERHSQPGPALAKQTSGCSQQANTSLPRFLSEISGKQKAK